MSLIIGLTGSIASGKSTIARMLAEFNIPIIDADQISREIVRPGETAYDHIVEQFGESVLLKDKTINRKKLGSIIFTNAEKRLELNQIMHPAIRKRLLSQRDNYVKQGEKCVVLDIPLLFENKLTNFADKVMVVYVDEEVQLDRLISRDNSSVEEATKRIQSQIPVKEKAELADFVINNNGTIEETYDQLKTILMQWNVI